ncbi:DUF4105 domain-containing protein [Methylococcus sp. EFPC2]|uniref:Lnb N-terminal periplasmic domain-containing protein n=1 Tax=Methylococcus sp. EFPC2 TaxID=2812648 RepID=UPI001967E948|nr:DUF4105 domain-containing protein [Methylococcus sp. EFPC2]QSA97201.1 DUF4105 domain-containing protein [Methylococcus sp. EFPC2]
MKWAAWLIAGLTAACPVGAVSASPAPPENRQRTSVAKLAQDEGWLALGHYRLSAFGDRWISDADDEGFFLAAGGKTDPEAELLADLEAFARPGGGDDHPACRFPARLHWLQSRLSLVFPEHDCPAFRTWRDKLRAHAVSLIFPAAYLNSPSSMFGHSFLRLDPEDLNPDNALLAATVNYAADADDDNELFYAWRGLFGGYPGRVTVLPYYEKVKEYNDLENRDIWEYRLNLAPAEVAQLVRHVWELRPIRFDYFFIGENCAYRLLGILDAARPGLALRRQFPLRAIPADTVRAIVAGGLLAEASYRPSAATLLDSHLQQLPQIHHALARRLADRADEKIELASDAKAGVLEVAYEFSRYRALDEKRPREAEAGNGYRLLRARSRVDVPSPFEPPPIPAVRDDQGHRSRAAGLELGWRDHRAYGEFNLRSAYHGLTDPWPGYRAGAAIRFLDGALRYYENGDFRLDRLDVLDIRSFSPRDEFFKPLSWGLGLGAKRSLLREGRPLLGYFGGDAGFAWELAGGLAYLQAGALFETGTALASGVDFGLGPRLGWLYRGLGGQGWLSFSADCHLVNGWCGGKLGLEHTVNLGSDLSLSFRISRERGWGREVDELGLGLRQFF